MIIRVVSHNVYWFQGHPFSGTNPGAVEPEVFQRLCHLYRSLEPTVLCLQEIQGAEVSTALAAQMQMETLYSPGGVYPQYGCLLASKLCPAAPFPKGPTLERSIVAAHIPLPKGTLGIASIHLSSGRQTGPAAAKAARLQEMTEFLARHEAEIDIIAGDFNEAPNGGVGDLLRARGFVDASTIFGKEEVSTRAGGNGRKDLIWIKAERQNQVVDYGVAIEELAADDLPDKAFLSDHRPLWVTLELP